MTIRPSAGSEIIATVAFALLPANPTSPTLAKSG
jgi:hypothetical protein